MTYRVEQPKKKRLTVRRGRHEKTALNRRIICKYFDFKSDSTLNCVGDTLDIIRTTVVRPHVIKLLQEKGSIKFQIRLHVLMKKALGEDEFTPKEIAWFNSEKLPLQATSQFDDIYNVMTMKVWTEFEDFVTNGSGWVIDNILGFDIATNVYNPLKIGSSHFLIPPQLKGSSAIINVKERSGRDTECFKLAVACSVFHKEIKEKYPSQRYLLTRATTYRSLNLLEEFDFNGIEAPLPSLREKHFERFKKQNQRYAINIVRLKCNECDETEKADRKQLNILPHRTSVHKDRIQIYLLNLFDPKTENSHFVSIINFSLLISNCASSKNRHSIFCVNCNHAFRGDTCKQNFERHKVTFHK